MRLEHDKCYNAITEHNKLVDLIEVLQKRVAELENQMMHVLPLWEPEHKPNKES